MSMTYADVTTNTADVDATGRSADEVFVPRYAQRRSRSNKTVKTWMIIAPIGALAVIGTAAALMMGGDAPAASASSTPPPSDHHGDPILLNVEVRGRRNAPAGPREAWRGSRSPACCGPRC